jgi:hypothetical protein
MAHKTTIKTGDEFEKIGEPGTVWIVKRLVDKSGLPPHVELTAKGYMSLKILISEAALRDDKCFRQITNT